MAVSATLPLLLFFVFAVSLHIGWEYSTTKAEPEHKVPKERIIMLTFEKVFEIFKEYLAADAEVEIVTTSRGHLRIEWAGSSPYCDDGYLCRTPEELFDKLMEDFRGYQEVKLTRGRREPTEEEAQKVQAMCLSYLEKREEEEQCDFY